MTEEEFKQKLREKDMPENLKEKFQELFSISNQEGREFLQEQFDL